MKRILVATVLLSTGLSVRAYAQSDPPPPPAGTVVRTWNQLAIDTVRIKASSDAQAARAYAMMNAAMYDAVWGILSNFNGARTRALVSPSGSPSNGDLWAAAASAAHAVLIGLYPDQFLRFDTQLAADMAAAPGGSGPKLAGQSWGAAGRLSGPVAPLERRLVTQRFAAGRIGTGAVPGLLVRGSVSQSGPLRHCQRECVFRGRASCPRRGRLRGRFQ